MKGAKKAKTPKKLKSVKAPVKAIELSTKQERKLEKKCKKELIKKGKLLNKKINTGISVCAVLLCIISSLLDIILKNRAAVSSK